MAVSNYIPSSRVMQPGVCTSSTRPASPFVGMTIFETDTSLMRLWTGSAWRTIAYTAPAQGSVLQVVTGYASSVTANSSTSEVNTGLTATITPTSTTSKILVIATQQIFCPATAMGIRLYRNSTVLILHTNAGYSAGGTTVMTWATNYIDSPSSTSALTYKTTFALDYGSGTVYAGVNNPSPAQITLMEIAA